MRFSIYQESKKGGRRVNQDRMGYLYTRDSLMMMVADGMGGHARGEVAAELTMQTVAAMFQAAARPILADPARFLDESIHAAHRELHRYRAEHSLPEAPRTTVVVCVIQEGVAHWAHAGDSRLYLLRSGRIAERTTDHSRVHHLVASGLIRPEEARDHPERNRIFNCLGAFVEPQVELGGPVGLRSGDTILLCSDGLWGALPDQAITEKFSDRTVMRAVPDLISEALEIAGPEADNCTAVALAWAGIEDVNTEGGGLQVSTEVMPDGVVASTIQVPRVGDEPDPFLTDAQIDDAVNEIQQAIARASRLIPEK
jgi:protein phosphatase